MCKSGSRAVYTHQMYVKSITSKQSLLDRLELRYQLRIADVYEENVLLKTSRINISLFFFSSRRRHTRFDCDWSSDVCSSDLLVALSRTLSEEEQRHVREQLTEEELVVFDILTRPAPELSTEERAEVKKVTKLLLERLKALLVLDWRKRQSARARVEDAIKDALDSGLPRAYSTDLYQQKCSAMFEHFYENYLEKDANVYVR